MQQNQINLLSDYRKKFIVFANQLPDISQYFSQEHFPMIFYNIHIPEPSGQLYYQDFQIVEALFRYDFFGRLVFI